MEPHLAEDEELQKLKQWWKKNGNSIIIGIVLGLSGIVGFNGWNSYVQNRSESAAGIYAQLRKAVEADSVDSVAQLSTELTEDFAATPYSASGALIAAAHQFSSGEVESARKLLNWVLASDSVEPLKQTARLRLGWLELAESNADRTLQLVSEGDQTGFEAFFAELAAEANLQKGSMKAAIENYDRALAVLAENSEYTLILQAKRNAIAGEN